MPRYKLHQTSYVDNQLIVVDDGHPPAEHAISASHVPGPHWEPMDDEARALMEKHGVTFTGFVPDSVDFLTEQLAKALKAKADAEKLDPNAIGKGVVAALLEAGIVKAAAPAKPAEAKRQPSSPAATEEV